MIKEDYVSFEVAKLLKEKGMNKSCFKHYVQKNNNDGTSEAVTVCTLQMAMKWLREIKHIECHIVMDELKQDNTKTYMYDIYSNSSDRNFNSIQEYGFGTYEHACEAAIKYCLTKLI